MLSSRYWCREKKALLKYSREARSEAVRLAQLIWNSRDKLGLDVPSGSIDEMILKSKEYPDKTVFISDSGDNTTAGAPGDNTQVLEALLRHEIPASRFKQDKATGCFDSMMWILAQIPAVYCQP